MALPQRSSKELLAGQLLRWVCWDERQFVAAAARTMIDQSPLIVKQQVANRLVLADSLGELREIVSTTEISLVLWACHQTRDMPRAVRSIRSVWSRFPECRRVCYVSDQLAEQAAIFYEAGAQTVVSQIPSLQRALPKLLQTAPLFRHGFHPLTTGLVDRLPLA